MSKKTNQKPMDEWCIYLGPTIRGYITSGGIYSCAAEKVASKIREMVPARFSDAAFFVIPGNAEAVSRARTDIRTVGTYLNTKYHDLAVACQKKEV